MAIILRWRYTPQVGAGDVTSLAAIVGPRGNGIASVTLNEGTGVWTVTLTDGTVTTYDDLAAAQEARDAAQTAQGAAETAAGTATTKAGEASASATATAADRVQTGLDRTAAETARDGSVAAAASVGVYSDATLAAALTTGLAAVSEGQTFHATGSDVEYIGVYKDVSGVAVEQARYPNAALVAKLAARDVGFLNAPSASSPLYRVLRVEFYSSISGVAVDLPANLTIRECGRDLTTSAGRFRLRFAEFDGVSTYTEFARENGNGFFLAGAQNGLTWVEIEASTTALGFAVGTVIGRALIDFGSDDVFGTYGGTIAHSVGGIVPSLQQSGPRFENDVSERILDNISLTKNYRLPFADSVTATAIRRLVRDVRLYNADPTHQYVFSVLTVETFATPLTRFRMTIRDITAGADVCTVAKSVSSQPGWASFVATLESPVKLTSSGLSPASNTGIYAVVDLNWSAVSDFFSYGSNTYTLAGISPEQVYTDDDIADYLDSDHAHEVITVGASGADFTTLRAAVESTYSWVTGASPVTSAPICDRACYHHRVLIRMIDDATYDATFLLIPEWVEIQGNGYGRTLIERENTDADAMIEMHLCGKMRDLTIISETSPEYCIHSDDFNRNASGGAAQNRTIRQSFKRMRLRGAAGHTGYLFGGGLSAGQHILFDDVIAEHADGTVTTAAFLWHNTGPTLSTPSINVGTKPSLIEMRGCGSPDYNGVYLQTLHTAGICVLSLTDCTYNRIQHEIPAGEVTASGRARIGWEITGQLDAAWINSDGNADSFTLEWAPHAAQRRRVRNGTGASIPKGRFVRFTGVGNVALCGANERPEAWTIAAIADGANGDVILNRRIDDAYIDAAEANSGEWGITADGTLDYSAVTKLGRTIGGVVEVYR